MTTDAALAQAESTPHQSASPVTTHSPYWSESTARESRWMKRAEVRGRVAAPPVARFAEEMQREAPIAEEDRCQGGGRPAHTKASATLENREVPTGYVRPAAVARYIASRQTP